MKVLYLTNIPVPYKIDFLNELGKEVELTVLFDREIASDRNVQWLNKKSKTFKAIFLESYKIKEENALAFSVIKYLNNKYDFIIVGTHSNYTALLAMLYMKIKGIKYIFNCDGGVFFDNESNWKYLLKKFFVSNAEFYLSTGKHTNKWLTYYGASEKKIFVYPFASFFEKYIEKRVPTNADKNFFKGQLNIKNKYMIISIGRFIDLKGFDVLIKSAEDLKNIDVVIYIIGGNKPKESWIKIIREKNLTNVKFLDFQDMEHLKLWYKAADVFVLPTRQDSWGLVVNEAMANGLPVITTDKCNAGLELIEDKINGYIIPINNSKKLAEKVLNLLENKNLRENISKNNLIKIKKYTIENMANRYLKILKLVEHNNEKCIDSFSSR